MRGEASKQSRSSCGPNLEAGLVIDLPPIESAPYLAFGLSFDVLTSSPPRIARPPFAKYAAIRLLATFYCLRIGKRMCEG